MTIEGMTLDHIQRIKLRNLELEDMGPGYLQRYAQSYLACEYKKAVLDKDGEVIFIFGGKLVGHDAGQVWLQASDLLYTNPVASLETILRLHEEGCAQFPQVVRLFTYNDPRFPVAINFLKRLGYEEADQVSFKEKYKVSPVDGKERILLVKELT